MLVFLNFFINTLSVVLYGAVEHWLSGALVNVGDMIYDMIIISVEIRENCNRKSCF